MSVKCTKQYSLIVNPSSGKLNSAITLVSLNNPAGTEKTVTLRGTVTTPFIGAGANAVKFFDGATLLGTAPFIFNSISDFPWVFTAGTHVLTAQYVGNATYNPSTSNPVNQLSCLCPNNLTIQNFSTLLANPCPGMGFPASGFPPWDGVIPSSPPGTLSCTTFGNLQQYFVTGGKSFPGGAQTEGPILEMIHASLNTWTMTMYTNGNILIWSGSHDSTTCPPDPRGIYIQTGGCLVLASLNVLDFP